MGWVSSSLQEVLHTNDTVEEIVLSGKYASIGLYEKPGKKEIKKADSLIEQFELSDLKNRIYYTLSQGEKQKVIIARALMSSPKLLILDEPCTGLDLFARENLLSLVEQTGNSKKPPALLYVSHHIEEIIPIFKHTVLLKNGSAHSAGKTKEVLTKSNLLNFYGRNVDIDWKNNRPWVKA